MQSWAGSHACPLFSCLPTTRSRGMISRHGLEYRRKLRRLRQLLLREKRKERQRRLRLRQLRRFLWRPSRVGEGRTRSMKQVQCLHLLREALWRRRLLCLMRQWSNHRRWSQSKQVKEQRQLPLRLQRRAQKRLRRGHGRALHGVERHQTDTLRVYVSHFGGVA